MNRSSERGNKREEEGEKRTRGKISRTRAGEKEKKKWNIKKERAGA